MLLASVNHPDVMAHDVSASRNLELELPLEYLRQVCSVLSIGTIVGIVYTVLVCSSPLYKELLITDADCECLLALFSPGCDLDRQVLLAC